MENGGLKIATVKDSLHKILEFLTTYLPLANAHVSEFITDEQWERLVPDSIRQELIALTDDELKLLLVSGYPGDDKEYVHKLKTDLKQLETVSNEHALETEADKGTDVEPVTKIKSQQIVPCTCNNVKESEFINIENEGKLSSDTSYLDTEVHFEHDSVEHAKEISKSQAVAKTERSDKDSSLTDNCGSQFNETMNWKHRNLRDFCNDALSKTIDGQDLAITVEKLFDEVGVTQNDKDVFVSSCMIEKKSHEVNIMSGVCAQFSKYSSCQVAVDIGSGKGYLGQTLFLQHKMIVLGIDAAPSNTSSANRRLGIVGKQWEGLTRNLKNQQNGVKVTKKQKKQLKSKQKLQKVTKESDINVDNGSDFVNKRMDNAKTETNNVSVEILPYCPENQDKDRFSHSENDGLGCYIPVTMYVDTNTNLKAIAMEAFPFLSDDKDRVGIHVDSMSCDNKLASNQNLCVVNENKLHDDGLLISVSQTDTQESSVILDDQTETEFEKLDICQSSSQELSDHMERPKHTNDSVISDKNQGNRGRNVSDILLTGLHTCGDLASSTLELFVANSDVKSVCSAGCCYHLLTERFLQDTDRTEEDGAQFGFPLSSYLKEKRLMLGNTARNLASQSVHRIADSEEGCKFYPRALLQKVIEDLVDLKSVKWVGLRRLEQRSSDVSDYIRKAWRKLSLPENMIPDTLIQQYQEQYGKKKRQLGSFFQVKTVLAPCIESLILLDRVLFLLEQDTVKDVYLVKMFDPQVSPRCYGIVATKR